jgi:hypothetical protein
MDIGFDPAKRKAVLDAGKLDMADAGKIFDGPTLTHHFVEEANGKEQKAYGPRLR